MNNTNSAEGRRRELARDLAILIRRKLRRESAATAEDHAGPVDTHVEKERCEALSSRRRSATDGLTSDMTRPAKRS